MNWSGTYDTVVIGGGPAGLTAAIALARGGARVALFDVGSRAQEPTRIDTLEARLASDLAKLGVVDPIEGATAIAVASA
jgi:2-polyprenyl-6-methoxyphenol hydroxylase-like FAD-dependent oxidoreductase